MSELDVFPVPDEPIVVAQFRFEDGSLTFASGLDGVKDVEPADAFTFVLATHGTFKELVGGLSLHSSVEFDLPTADLDSEERIGVGVGFYMRKWALAKRHVAE